MACLGGTFWTLSTRSWWCFAFCAASGSSPSGTACRPRVQPPPFRFSFWHSSLETSLWVFSAVLSCLFFLCLLSSFVFSCLALSSLPFPSLLISSPLSSLFFTSLLFSILLYSSPLSRLSRISSLLLLVYFFSLLFSFYSLLSSVFPFSALCFSFLLLLFPSMRFILLHRLFVLFMLSTLFSFPPFSHQFFFHSTYSTVCSLAFFGSFMPCFPLTSRTERHTDTDPTALSSSVTLVSVLTLSPSTGPQSIPCVAVERIWQRRGRRWRRRQRRRRRRRYDQSEASSPKAHYHEKERRVWDSCQWHLHVLQNAQSSKATK